MSEIPNPRPPVQWAYSGSTEVSEIDIRNPEIQYLYSNRDDISLERLTGLDVISQQVVRSGPMPEAVRDVAADS